MVARYLGRCGRETSHVRVQGVIHDADATKLPEAAEYLMTVER